MNFDRKILTTFLIMNERITSKKSQKLHKCQHFFGFQLAGATPVLLFRATGVGSTSHYGNRAVNRQPSFRTEDS